MPMKRRCPLCNELLEGITTDWILTEKIINGHTVATISTTWNASRKIEAAVGQQIAANLAAYELDYDVELNLGFRGTAWVQCPQAREKVTRVTFQR